MTEGKNNFKDIVLFGMLLSGSITLIVVTISLVAWMFLRDPLLFTEGPSRYIPSKALIKMFCYVFSVLAVFVYVPFKLGIQERTISKKGGIVVVTLLTYLLSCASLAVFLSLTTEMIDYGALPKNEYPETAELIEAGIPCTFDLKESFFDAVSGFTTTGLTAFKRTGEYINGREISKIDAQPMLIHIIRAAYLWIGGLGIMFFYLYFTPVPSLMMSMGYEIPTERSLPRFIRLESLSFSLVYGVITALGILLLFLSISSGCQFDTEALETKSVISYSVILTFSSISTGGFTPEAIPVDNIRIGECNIINNWGLLILMFLMVAGAMPLFSLHRPLKFFNRWKLFAVFLFPILVYGLLSYFEEPEVSDGLEVSDGAKASLQKLLHRSFDAISAFTTTGLYTSQFEEDSRMPPKTEYMSEYKKTEYKSGDEIEIVKEIYEYRFRNIYIIVLMFIGGAAYSTAGGWGFFNFFCILYAFYLILTGKLERVLTKYILGLILSFLIFFSIFAIGTVLCYHSGLFGKLSGPEPAAVTDYVINSAFYEISALSTVGLMPDSMIQDEGIYHNDLAYWTLAVSMLIGRLYYIIFPFLVSLIVPAEGI